jgi:mRNA interferase RelE/StbE
VTDRILIYDTAWLPAFRDLVATDKVTARRVMVAVNVLARDPEPPGSSNLSGGSFYRLHVGDYRIMYEVGDDFVRVWSLGRVP